MEYIGFILKDDAFNFCKNVFMKMGLSEENAKIVSDHLVIASLRGVDSHGLTRILPYVIGLEKGIVNPNPKIKILKEKESIVLMDGDNALGQIPAFKAMNIVIEKAIKTGIGIASLKNIGHVGMLAYYGLKISEKNLIGMICTSGPSRVVPWGGKKRLLGTNPICFSFPFKNGKAIILDIATSIVASFKIKLMAERGEKVPLGMILDKNGNPTTNPKDYINGGALMPFGEYKGYGLAIAVEILSSLLSGAPHTIHIADSPAAQGGLFIEAININAFRPYEEYIKDLEEIVNLIKSCPLLNGFNEILLPGELEERIYEKRIKEGIPIHESTWKEFKIVSEKLKIDLPKIIMK
jgi:LDH2 family malate/lactate/ureidoglycolate dehydrogenase